MLQMQIVKQEVLHCYSSLMEIFVKYVIFFTTVLHLVLPLNLKPMKRIKKYRPKHLLLKQDLWQMDVLK